MIFHLAVALIYEKTKFAFHWTNTSGLFSKSQIYSKLSAQSEENEQNSHIVKFFLKFTKLAQSVKRTRWNRTNWGLLYLYDVQWIIYKLVNVLLTSCLKCFWVKKRVLSEQVVNLSKGLYSQHVIINVKINHLFT